MVAAKRRNGRSARSPILRILDIVPTNWWSKTVDLTLAVPNTGFREATGGSATWISSMLYTNFNF